MLKNLSRQGLKPESDVSHSLEVMNWVILWVHRVSVRLTILAITRAASVMFDAR